MRHAVFLPLNSQISKRIAMYYVSKRMEIKNLIAELKKVNPHIESNIFRSVENVNLHTVIAYKKDGVKHSFLEGYDD